MKEIQHIAKELQKLIGEVPVKMHQFSIEEINHKPSPEKWSKKEILGHLCDSCFNNLQRIIRVQYEGKSQIVYNQDQWVIHQNYQEREFVQVIDLWLSLHKQLVHIIKSFPENCLESIVDAGEEVTARFIITDYLDHQNHHFKQIFEGN